MSDGPDRGKQLRRQWAILAMLESARLGLTVDEIADQLDEPATGRTLYRDLALLGEVFEITSEGRPKRFKLLAGERGRLTIQVQPTEVLALMLGEDLLVPMMSLSIAQPIANLRKRLRAVLTPRGREYVDAHRRIAMATTFAPPLYEEGARDVVKTITDAIEECEVLRIAYTGSERIEKTRDVEPYRLLYHTGRLYVVAWCRLAEGLRNFSVQRISTAERLDESFDPDPTFDFQEYAQRAFGVYQGPIYQVVIVFGREVAHLARERDWHRNKRLRDLPDGGVRLSMETAGLPEIASWLAGFGGKVVPREPPELVALVRAIDERGLASLP